MLASIMKKQALARMAVLFGLCGSAFAAPLKGAKIGVATFAGTGCSAGSGSATVDGDQVRITLQQFVVQAKAGASVARGTCNVSIPIQVERGHQIAIRALSIEGQTQLSADSKARANTELFFAGTRGKPVAEELPTKGSSLKISRRPSESELQWSACGAQPIARANIDFQLQSKSVADSVQAETLTLEIISRKCL